jgi:CRISPR type III-A-associated RAMP protein Csm4
MSLGFTIRLRPTGPWRIGPANGAKDRVDVFYRSDALYSAVTSAMRLLGSLEDWLQATAANAEGPSVRFSSCFPFIKNTGLVTPPRTLWPPPASAKVRWKGARFAPLPLVKQLIAGKPPNEDAWSLDGPSQCLVPSGRSGPFRTGIRKSAAVDRLTGQAEPHSAACIEFAPDCGLWCRVAFRDEEASTHWGDRVKTAFRLLADSGFGGERSRGWGRAETPFFSPLTTLHDPVAEDGDYWLLSLFVPGPSDQVDWAKGSYSVLSRGGRVESLVRSGEEKKLVDMIEEGSVLSAAVPLSGSAPDVAPDGFPHPVFRSGFAFAIPMHDPEVFA